MPNDENRRTVIERADRTLRQSRTLRKLAGELLQESKEQRDSAKGKRKKAGGRARR